MKFVKYLTLSALTAAFAATGAFADDDKDKKKPEKKRPTADERFAKADADSDGKVTLDELKDVSGVKLAGGHRTFKMEGGKVGEQMRFTEVSGVKFLPKGTVDLGIPE